MVLSGSLKKLKKQKNEEGMDLEVKEVEKPERLGCEHYARKCIFISPCCKKEYPCRICHDDGEIHEINRNDVTEIKCRVCDLQQKVQNSCDGCSTVFGKYFCEKCRLYDDEEKGQFHCDGCGLCRVGGKEKFFHCEKCSMCLSVKLEGNHKCVEESSRRNCAICLEDLHTSRIDAHIPPCGHLIHRVCYEQCVKSGNYACPTCSQSLLNMKKVWEHLDEEVANTPMPEEYRNFMVYILCRDCHKNSKVKFHVIGLKCDVCGSYNTCRDANPNEEEVKENGGAEGTGGVSALSDIPPEGAVGVTTQSDVPPVGTEEAIAQLDVPPVGTEGDSAQLDVPPVVTSSPPADDKKS